MHGANQANGSAPSTEAVNQAIAVHQLRYWQASDAPGTHSLASIANWLGQCRAGQQQLNGKVGLAYQLAQVTIFRNEPADVFKLEPYTKVVIEVHKRAFSWFDPNGDSANKYMEKKCHRIAKVYAVRHPLHGIGAQFTKVHQRKKFSSKQTVGTVILHRLTNIGEEHLLKCISMPPNFTRAMSIEAKLDRYTGFILHGRQAERAMAWSSIEDSLQCEFDVLSRRGIKGDLKGVAKVTAIR